MVCLALLNVALTKCLQSHPLRPGSIEKGHTAKAMLASSLSQQTHAESSPFLQTSAGLILVLLLSSTLSVF